jgi:hypothetical protein
LGVIGLHSNSFKPHTGTKTSLLFLHKYTQAELAQQKNKSDYPIFFATSKLSFKDNSGRYVFATDQDGNAIVDKYKNQMYFTDLFDVVEAFKEFGLEELKNGNNAFSFLEGEPKAKNIPYSKITANEVANYNLRLDAEYWDLEVLKVIEKIKSTDYAPLHKFTTISGGFAWKSEFFGEKGEGLPFVRIRDCKPTYIDNENLTTLAPEYVKNLDIPQAQKGDIVVGMDGLKYFYGSLIVEPVYVNQRVCHLKVLENSELEPEYIVFIINSKIGQTQLLRQMTIADTVGHITNVDVHNLLIPLFDKETRAKITESVKKSIEAEINAKKLIKLAKQAVEIYVEQDEQSALQYIEKGLETV